MIRSIILCPDQGLAERLEAALNATGVVSVGRTLNQYPSAIELVRTLRAHAPDVLFLSFESVEKAHETIKLLETEAEGVQVVAIHRQCDATLLRETMRAGIRELYHPRACCTARAAATRRRISAEDSADVLPRSSL